jgi:hypothetical protein
VSMNPEIKAAWLAWLRANGDKQGMGLLRSWDDKYCCLGGLCELAVQAGVVQARRRPDEKFVHDSGAMEYFNPNFGEDEGGWDSDHTVLPNAVIAWAGLEDYDPDVNIAGGDGDEERRSLSSINDEGTDFGIIADLIEVQL